MAVVRDNHQVVLHIEGDAVRVGQLGRITFEQPERRLIVGRLLGVDDHGRRELNRHIEFLACFIGCDAPRAMRRGQEPVGSHVSPRILRENRHPILRVVVRDVDVEGLRIDIRPAHHLGTGLVSPNDPFRLSEARCRRSVVQPRVLHNAIQVLIRHHHHAVLGIDGDGTPGRVRIFDEAQRLLIDVARTGADLKRRRSAGTRLLCHGSGVTVPHKCSYCKSSRKDDQPTALVFESHLHPLPLVQVAA